MSKPTSMPTKLVPLSQTKLNSGSQSTESVQSTPKLNLTTTLKCTMIMEFSNNGTANGISTLPSTATNLWKTSAYVLVLPTTLIDATQITGSALTWTELAEMLLGTTEPLLLKTDLLLDFLLPMVSLTTSSLRTTFCSDIKSMILLTLPWESRTTVTEKTTLIGVTSEDISITLKSISSPSTKTTSNTDWKYFYLYLGYLQRQRKDSIWGSFACCQA